MELFLQASDQKTSLGKHFIFLPRISTLIFKTGNGIIQTGNGIIPPTFQASDQKTYFTKCFSFVPRGANLIFKTGNAIIQTGNGIIFSTSRPLITKLLQNLFYLFQGFQIIFQNRKWNHPNRKWIISPPSKKLQDLQEINRNLLKSLRNSCKTIIAQGNTKEAT